MKITIQTSALLAAQVCAAKKDIRAQLLGVNIQIKRADKGMVYGTDGHVLFAGQIHYTSDVSVDALNITIPNDTIKKINKKAAVTLLEIDNGQYMIDGIRFTPIDLAFPDVARVIPDIQQDAEQSAAEFNPDLLVRARDALSLYTGLKPKGGFSMFQRGDDSAVVHVGSSDCLVVVMPLRSPYRDKFVGFNRDFM
jgi:DNA polymerase III sliding clamp (beta) subunit (PCNA family)